MALAKMHPEYCLIAGAITLRTARELPAAIAFWRRTESAQDALLEGLLARAALSADECAPGDDAYLFAGYFIFLQYCLLFAGERGRLEALRGMYESPFVVVKVSEHERWAPLAAEGLIQFAAWSGDVATTAELAASLTSHYEEFSLAPVYAEMWKAVAARDGQSLDKCLPQAESAYKQAARRRSFDIWGGDKSYNQAMFDIYTTGVLKIARDVGMQPVYRSTLSEKIWPEQIISHWLN